MWDTEGSKKNTNSSTQKRNVKPKAADLKPVLKDTKDSADMVTHAEESKHVNTITDLQQNQMK